MAFDIFKIKIELYLLIYGFLGNTIEIKKDTVNIRKT